MDTALQPNEYVETPCVDPSAEISAPKGTGSGKGEQCAARSKRTGERCRAAAVHGRKVCYHHGGATPRGLANPRTKHATIYSPYLKGTDLELHEQLAARRDLHDLTGDIASLTNRIVELQRALQAGESDSTIEAIRDAVDDAQEAQVKGTLDISVLLQTLSALAHRHMERESIRHKLDAAHHSRAKLVDLAKKHEVMAGDMASKAEHDRFLVDVAAVARAYISDPALLQAMGQDLQRIRETHPAVARPVYGHLPVPASDAVTD